MGILIVLVVIVAIVLVVMQATKGISRAADQFFALLKDGQVEEAYASTAKEFQAATSLDEFQAFLKSTAIGNFDRASWSSRSISNNTGKLEGSIHTKDGGVVPVELALVKEGGTWKILSLAKQVAGLAEKERAEEATKPTGVETTTGKEIPSDQAIMDMVHESVYLLGDGLNHEDLSNFYGHISKLWQSQTDEASLRRDFQRFIDEKVDLTIMEKETPVLSEKPWIDDDGVLRLKGYYATKPYMVHFDLGYIYEYPQWKLFSIKIRIQ